MGAGARGAEESPDRALRVASAALGAVAKAESESALYQRVCALLTEEAGYALAWVGAKQPGGEVCPVAWTGDGSYPAGAATRWDEGPRAQGPTGRAVREGRTAKAVADETSYSPWQEAARAQGFSASCAVPIRVGDAVVGALNVYATREGAFDADEVRRLEEIADVLGRGVELFRGRAELSAARDQLQALYDASPDMIFVHGGDGRILDVNERVLEALRVTRQLLIEGPPEATISDRHSLEEALGNTRRALEEGSHDFEWEAKRGDGTTFPVEVRLRRLPGADPTRPDVPALVAIVRDLTERKRFEAQLVESSKLESLSLFAGGVAHDFNNFLSAVLGAASALEPTLEGDERSAFLRDVIDAAQGARGLTRQLLAFARGGASARGTFDLGPLIHQAARLTLAGRGLRAELEVPDSLWAIDGDRDQLTSVLHNLVLNAVQASPEGAVIRLRAENERIQARPPLEDGPHVRVEVSDLGPGMDAQTLARAFDPFFTTKREGSGLGLPTARAVVRRHDGDLQLESAPGRGTTVRLWLPALEVRPPARSASAPPQRDTSRLRILLLEDEASLQRIFGRMLEQLGHDVVIADHGDEALEKAAQLRAAGARVDVAILDLTVRGGRGGREILAELREALPDTRVVGTSGYSDVDPSTVPFDAFLPKPFTLGQLRRILRE